MTDGRAEWDGPTMNDVLAVDVGYPSGNVLQVADDEAEVWLLGALLMKKAGNQSIRNRDVTELLEQHGRWDNRAELCN